MNTAEPTLERTLGLASSAAFGLAAMIGTGVFVTAGLGAGLAGPAVLVALLVAGGAAACNGLSSAELAMAHPRSGATYEYASRRLAPWAGALAGWLFLASKSASAAAAALAFGAYVGAGLGIPPLVVTFGAVLGTTALALTRLTKAGAFNVALLALSLGSLLAFAALEGPRAKSDHFTPFAPGGIVGILEAASLLFVAYAGFGRIATMGEEIRDPRRNIPRALLIALGGAAAVYLGVTATALGVAGAPEFAAAARGSHAPLEAMSANGFVKKALAVGAGAAIGSAFLNLLLGISRMAFAMARGGHLPKAFSRVNAASSPWAAVLLTGGAVAALAALRRLELLLTISAFAVLLYYTITNLCALRLSKEERIVPPAVPVLGIAACVVLAAASAWRLAHP